MAHEQILKCQSMLWQSFDTLRLHDTRQSPCSSHPNRCQIVAIGYTFLEKALKDKIVQVPFSLRSGVLAGVETRPHGMRVSTSEVDENRHRLAKRFEACLRSCTVSSLRGAELHVEHLI